MNTAIVDIDNTLWQFCDAFYAELKKVNSAFPTVERWDTWDFFVGYCTEEQFLAAVDAVHRRQDRDGHRPCPEAKGFLRSLREQGYRIVIASHYLERIGDRATNIAEDIVFLVTGEVEDLNP